MINIIENTLRDGSYVIDFQFSQEQTYDITSGLDQLGFQYIEVGHGLGLGAWNNPKIGLAKESDEVYITTAKKVAENAKVVAFFIPEIGTIDDIQAAYENGLDFIRIGTNINEYQKCLEYAQFAKKLGLKVAVNLMKSYAVKSYEFSKIVQEINKWQVADVIYLVDSAGCMMPHEVTEYIDRTKQKITTELGFHGHNNLSMAVANSIQAIEAGATYIDTCVRGMGRSAGNAQTEIVIWMFEKLGLTTGINLYDLYQFADKVVTPLMPRVQGLSSDEIHIGVSKFHSSYMPYVMEATQKYFVDKKEVIKQTSDVNCLNPSRNLFLEVASQIHKNG